jgi:LPXTG-motif cell wall-anchored protein
MVFSAVSLVALAPMAQADDSYTGTCSIVISPLTVAAGGSVDIVAKGFTPGADVTFTIDDTTVIGTAVADSAGTAQIQWDVPDGFVLGAHVIAASGDGCNPADVAGEITVVAATEVTQPAAGSLPRTGSDYSNLLRVGILLVAAGALVVLATRKRSNQSTPV